MKEFNYTITDTDGIHARPAGELVKMAKAFESTITVVKGEKSADGKKIFSLMSLGVRQGDNIKIIADGTDEEKAVETLGDFLKNNL